MTRIRTTEDPQGLLLDFRNNVIYNWAGGHAGYNADKISVTRLNYVGNYLIPGPDSDANGIAYRTGSPFNRAFFAGNFYNGKMPENQWNLVQFRSGWTDEEIHAYKQSQPFETGPIHPEDANTAYQRVLQIGGASLPKRDAVDTRIVKDVKQRTGKIIKSQKDVGGWPDAEIGACPCRHRPDGMPDAWETAHGLNPNDPEDRNAIGEGGYTRLEQYLNELCATTRTLPLYKMIHNIESRTLLNNGLKMPWLGFGVL